MKKRLRRQRQTQRDAQAGMRWEGVKAGFQRTAQAMLRAKFPAEDIDRMADRAMKRYLRGSAPIK